ncbi:MAG: DUF87 domain-containing protein [Verrucomicrobiae bacterium]|nr:DUF87 domain-containing protein [Verrucomicrobiae bacterium]
MNINVEDYEKLGAFYLGRGYDLKQGKVQDDLLLYDSKDLVTHGLVLGMTGSGKTGLCLAILEEAMMDDIPAIVIDPKGDIANLMLTFPDLQGSDFRPWINEEDAVKKGKTPDEFASQQAEMWKNGLAEWGQSGDRVRTLRDKVDVRIYTPGSSAGLPVSILSSLDVPPFEILDEPELFSDCIESSVSSILSLLGIDADPILSREHVFLSQVFSRSWSAGENLSLEKLILNIQSPSFDKIGVIGLESFYPQKDRMALAMQINGLLASPGFASWLNGEPMDVKQFLRDSTTGKPRVSIFSIAHLSEKERMFVVSLLLNQVQGWMRGQSGTTSLRAMLYMDEIYGYLPPTADPPSKKPLMTMLKQARAYGLGVLLATQNPVDLDYKALSNMGTWFLGRLQTERDKMRVLEGLEGAAATQGAAFDRAEMEQILAGLGNRVFLLNNVHEDGPVTFQVRWVMSYLRGPMTRRQIKQLMDPVKAARQASGTETSEAAGVASAAPADKKENVRAILPSGVKEYFLRIRNPRSNVELIYLPAVLRSAEVYVSDSKLDVDGTMKINLITRIRAAADDIAWDESEEIDVGPAQMDASPFEPCTFGELPGRLLNASFYKETATDFENWIYRERGMNLLKSPAIGLHSKPGEAEVDFRARVKLAAAEERDRRVEALREKYRKEGEKLEDKLRRAEIAHEKEVAQARSAKMSSLISIGSSVLGALMGRKKLGVTTMRRAGTSMRSMSRAWEQGKDVDHAEDKIEAVQEDIKELEKQLTTEMDEVRSTMDAAAETFEEVTIKPLKKNIDVKAVGIVWVPAYRVSDFELEQAWKD